MAMNAHEAISREIDDIVRVSEALSRAASTAPKTLGAESVEEVRGAASRLGHVILMLSGASSPQLSELRKIQDSNGFTVMHANHFGPVAELCGLAKAVQHQLRNGLFANMRGLLQAEVFDDFLDMAEHLLVEGYKDPAAVLIGCVLEDTLRKRSERDGLALADAKGKKFTLDPLNTALAKAGVYNVLVQKQVTAWADLRNKAAHGHPGEYDAAQVSQMLVGVRKFCMDYLP